MAPEAERLHGQAVLAFIFLPRRGEASHTPSGTEGVRLRTGKWTDGDAVSQNVIRSGSSAPCEQLCIHTEVR
ncbi:uncharacterized protein V6R79_015184 [Siganus canaliculatus]